LKEIDNSDKLINYLNPQKDDKFKAFFKNTLIVFDEKTIFRVIFFSGIVLIFLKLSDIENSLNNTTVEYDFNRVQESIERIEKSVHSIHENLESHQ